MRAAGIVLAGGRSSRMGRPKAWLPWEGTTLLAHVTGVVAAAVDGPVVVVRAPGQDLPPFAPGIELADDAREGRGPLQGLAAGLRAVGGRAEVAYVSSTDVPLLRPAFVRAVLAGLGDAEIALPELDGHPHPLAAAYRTALAGAVEEALAADRLGLMRFVDTRRVVRLNDLPDPASVTNVNDAADLSAARRGARAG